MANSDTERIYEEAGITDNLVGYGVQPALIVIDLQKGFTDPECVIGSDLSAVKERSNELIQRAHQSGTPVIFTRCVTSHPEGADLGIWQEKFPTLDVLHVDGPWVDIDPDLLREENDHILDKRQASAFHGTELHSMLTAMNIDTLVLMGCTTSGCVRATAVDGCANGYRVIVAEEGVGDRGQDPHDANLFDINAKYGDVRPVSEVESYLKDPSAST